MIHTGITSGCQTCHEKSYLWIGVNLYPISPTTVTANASYRGFQTRPYTTATTYNVADAGHEATGMGVGTDCVHCHTSTTAFTGVGKPDGHMPTAPAGSPACTACHSTAGDYRTSTLASTAALHGTMSSAFVKYTTTTIGTKSCVNCHAVGTGGTSGTAPFVQCTATSQANCPTPLTQDYQPKTVAASSPHVPTKTLDCNGCHAGSFLSFSGVNMKSSTNAASMHTNATLAGIQCQECHEFGMAWAGVTNLLTRVPSKHTTTSRKAPNDCSNCHSSRFQPIIRSARGGENGRSLPTFGGNMTRGSLGNTFDHQGVEVGKCKTCHDGRNASGMPARHLMTTVSCDTCHRTSTWKPAQFSHNGVSPNTCLACHNGLSASAKPAGHFMTARSCDTCHKVNGWKPVAYNHVSPAYRPTADAQNCVGCHATNSEIIPRQARAQNRVRPVVGP
jgi:hypothetical protein